MAHHADPIPQDRARNLATTAFLAVLVVLCVLVSAGSALAQHLWSDRAGVPTRTWDASPDDVIVPGHGTDETLVLWNDTRNQSVDLYGQLLDADGTRLWEPDGRLLALTPGRLEGMQAVMWDDGWLVAWLDDRNADEPTDGRSVFLQRYDTEGTPLWPSGSAEPPLAGRRLALPVGECRAFVLGQDGDGNPYLILGVKEGGDGLTVRVLRIGDDGNAAPGWPVSGLVLGTPAEDREWYDPVRTLPGDGESLWITWRQNWETDCLVRVTGPEAPTVVNQPVDEWCSDGEGGFFGTHEIWEWGEEFEEDEVRTRVFRYAPGGSGWVRNLSGMEPLGSYDAVLAPSEPGSAILVWDEGGYTNYYSYPRYQHIERIGGDSYVQYWSQAISLDTGATTDPDPPLSDNHGGAIIPFESSYWFQHVTVDGYLVFDPPLGEAIGRFSAVPLSDRIAVKTTDTYDATHNLRLQHYDPIEREFVPADSGYVTGDRVKGRVVPIWGFNTTYGFEVGAGAVWTAWLDERYGRHMAFVQRHDLDTGARAFGPYGVDLFPGLLDDASDDHFPVADNRGTIVEADDGSLLAAMTYSWTGDQQSDDPCVLQRISVDGERLWGESGVQLATAGESAWLYAATIVPDGEGGAYVACDADLENAENILLLARIDANGDPLWGGDGWEWVRRSDLDNSHLADIARFAGEDGFALAARRNDSLVVSRMDGDGTSLWTRTIGLFPDYDLTFAPIGDDLLATWGSNTQLVGQRIATDGSFLWGDDPLVLVELGENVLAGRGSVIPGGDGFWQVWRVPGGGQAARFDGNGQLAWDAPMPVSGVFWPAAQPDGSCYSLAIWDNPYPQEDPYVLYHLPANGQWNGAAPSVFIGSGGWEQQSRGMMSDGQGGVVVGWEEEYVSGGHHSFRLQRYAFDATGVGTETGPASPLSFSLAPVYPNPFNGTATVSFTLPQVGPVRVALVNVLGREVLTVADGSFAPGTHRLALDGSRLASGVYLLRASTGGYQSYTRKVVLVK